MRTRRLAPVALATVLGLTAAACGGSDSTSSGGGDKKPIKIAWMGSETGQYATKDRHFALDLAIGEINAAGGVGGRKIEYTAYDAGLTPEQGVTAVKKAITDKPTVIIGFATTAQVKATAPLLKSTGIPVLHVAQSSSVSASALGVNNIFRYGPTERMQTHALTDYVVKNVKPQNVGVLTSTDDGSSEAQKFIIADLKAAGITKITERKVPASATDLTEAVLALKDTDATFQWSFPAIDSLFLRQKHQNGLDMPTFGDNSGGSIVGANLNPIEQLKGYRYVISCAPDIADTPAAKKYVSAYKAKFGVTATNPTLAQGYDAVELVAAAIKQAGSTDPKAVRSAIGSISYDGVCGNYKADHNGDMFHSDVVVDASGGLAGLKLLGRYDGLQG